MELKCNNFNGEIVLPRKLNQNFFFLIVKNAFINKSYKLFLQEDG